MIYRHIPYGYEMSGGKIGISETESAVVRRIYKEYLDNRSLKDIAERLAEEKTEYLPGETAWNKNRIKRILEDIRYHRSDTYPCIINEECYTTAMQTMTEKNKKRDIETSDEISFVKKYVICYNCGQPLKRWYIGGRKEAKERWHCANRDCSLVVKISDNALLQYVTGILNELIGDSTLAELDEIRQESSLSLESKRLTSEIYRQLDAKSFDKEQLKIEIFECAAVKYKDILSAWHITERLKADFEKSSPLSIFHMDLFKRTVSHIRLNADGGIALVLKNSKNIERNMPNEHNDNADENGNLNPTPAGTYNGQSQSIPAGAGGGILPSID